MTNDARQTPVPFGADVVADLANTYDSFFAQHSLNPAGVASQVHWNAFYYGRYQPVSVAREQETLMFWQTFGRPIGNFLNGPRVVNAPQIIPSRIANPFLVGGAPNSILAYAKAATAAIIRDRGKR